MGINPGIRSALTGHHFAGPSNRFWKLLFESGLVPEPLTFEDDDRLPAFGFGITNLVARATPSISDLLPEEYRAGAHVLLGKIARYRPPVVALVGVTVYRALLAALDHPAASTSPVTLGPQPPLPSVGARLVVLPNPSGRNANYSYAEMLAAFRTVRPRTRLPAARR